MRPTWLLSGQVAGSVVLRPVLFGTTLFGALEMLARYFRVAETVIFIKELILIMQTTCEEIKRSTLQYFT